MTWYTKDPDFTPCFQQTTLVWFPCAFLWLFTPLEIFYIKNSINRNIPYGFVNLSKLMLTGSLIVLSIIDLAVAAMNNVNERVYPVSYITPFIKIATFVSKIVHFLFLRNCCCLTTNSFRFYQLCWLSQIEGSVCERLDCNFYSGLSCSYVDFHSYALRHVIEICDYQKQLMTYTPSTFSPAIRFSTYCHWPFLY